MQLETGAREKKQTGLEKKVTEHMGLQQAQGLASGLNRAAEQLLKLSVFINRSLKNNKEWVQGRKLQQIGMAMENILKELQKAEVFYSFK